jgi:pilus assembly protein Flp/PilA
MSKVLKLLNAVRKDEEGVTIVEYAILLGLISVVAIAVIGKIGTTVNSVFGTACTSLGTISGVTGC